MEFVGVYLIICIVIGVWAGSWGRNGFLWFLLALIISPLISGIILLIAGSSTPRSQRGIIINGEKITPNTHVICPDCAEYVKKEARVCKHCGTKLKPMA
tara:strand:+ start:38719 stop:39015 length:297 start_codon:yes stop_codon:yes gene_type:complete